MKYHLFPLFVLLLLFGCKPDHDSKPVDVRKPLPIPPITVSAKTTVLLHEPINSEMVELPPDALTVWNRHTASQPTLVLLSDDPFLQPLPPTLRQGIRELVQQGNFETLRLKVGTRSPDPLLLPLMAVSAAIEAEIFSSILWVLPAAPEVEQISLEIFKQQLAQFAGVTAEEAESFVRGEGNTFIGKVRGIPFVAAYPKSLPKLSRPAIIHIDISFFSPFYKNEIKTPLFPIVYSTLDALRKTSWPVLEVTISRSNLNSVLPVDTRFIGSVVHRLFYEPVLLDKPLPETWSRKKDNLYMENLFQPERMLENATLMVKAAPSDADVHFTLYQSYRDNKQGSEALEQLATAVKLDRGYAMEYFNLAQLAQEKKRPDQSVRMLELAAAAFPENPFIPLDLAKARLQIGQTDKALFEIKKLQQLSWSATYYPSMVKNLEEFSTQIKNIKTMPAHNQ